MIGVLRYWRCKSPILLKSGNLIFTGFVEEECTLYANTAEGSHRLQGPISPQSTLSTQRRAHSSLCDL
jgi:hypothetical protein